MDPLTNAAREKLYPTTHALRLEVSVDRQRLSVVGGRDRIAEYPVSTSLFGIGNEAGSNRTPIGLHRVCAKHGAGAPSGMIFQARQATGVIAAIEREAVKAETPAITSRILWLEGLEPGLNRGAAVDSRRRFIYIHGTNEEGLIGTQASQGCIRMTNRDVIELFDIVNENTRVLIFEGDARVVDSAMSTLDAMQSVSRECPPDLLAALELIEVEYWSFDHRIHSGQLLMHREVVQDVHAILELALDTYFPIGSMIPLADSRFSANGIWDDISSMAANNSSGFNYRTLAGSRQLSQHAHGTAIDINPWQNPCVGPGKTMPSGARYDPTRPGTLTEAHPIVRAFHERQWVWGGSWDDPKDYHHFEKASP